MIVFLIIHSHQGALFGEFHFELVCQFHLVTVTLFVDFHNWDRGIILTHKKTFDLDLSSI